jgi:hypothetical protein
MSDKKEHTINQAINKLGELTGEDFQGYRSEVWSVLASTYELGRIEAEAENAELRAKVAAVEAIIPQNVDGHQLTHHQ